MSEPARGRRLVGRPIKVGRLAFLAISAAVLIAVILGAYIVLSARQPALDEANREEIAEFSGEGDQITGSFTVGEGWQIHWQNDGQHFEFAIKGDFDFGTVIDQDAPGSGITSPVPTGTFHLEVTAEGPWSVLILQPR
jgi:hypothetical protein